MWFQQSGCIYLNVGGQYIDFTYLVVDINSIFIINLFYLVCYFLDFFFYDILDFCLFFFYYLYFRWQFCQLCLGYGFFSRLWVLFGFIVVKLRDVGINI